MVRLTQLLVPTLRSKFTSPSTKSMASPNMSKITPSPSTTHLVRTRYFDLLTQTTQDIYNAALKPLIPLLVQNGIVTCFAYGQTGSGKTFTMNGLQELIVKEVFEFTKKKYTVNVSFFEIYGGRCLDLLNNKEALNILEDKANNIQIQGLTEKGAEDAKELLAIMARANATRTTHATVANDTSSRSHSICQVFISKGNEGIGKLVLVDLAGSERAQDTQSNNRQRRMEGA